MSVRYYLTPDLLGSFSDTETKLQIERMKATGRCVVPSGEYIIRILWNESTREEIDKIFGDNREVRDRVAPPDQYVKYIDIHMRGAKVTRLFQTDCVQWRGTSASEKVATLARLKTHSKKPFWWEAGSWLCGTMPMKTTDGAEYVVDEDTQTELVDRLLSVLVISLQDRTVRREEAQHDSVKWKRLGLSAPREHDAREITIYCPGSKNSASLGGTHASPHMHYRSEHTRNQAHGPNNTLRKEVIIEATWVNGIGPADGGPVDRKFKLLLGK